MSDEYTGTPTVLRVYEENGEWFIDGIDTATGKYTDACWSYYSEAEALANVMDFIGFDKHYLFEWNWPTDLPYRVGQTVFLTEFRFPADVLAITDKGQYILEMANSGVADIFDADELEPYDAERWHEG